jgi:hypothetical protein
MVMISVVAGPAITIVVVMFLRLPRRQTSAMPSSFATFVPTLMPVAIVIVPSRVPVLSMIIPSALVLVMFAPLA